MALEDDARVLDAVEARLAAGVVAHREMTRDEALAVFRMAVFYRDAWAMKLEQEQTE